MGWHYVVVRDAVTREQLVGDLTAAGGELRRDRLPTHTRPRVSRWALPHDVTLDVVEDHTVGVRVIRWRGPEAPEVLGRVPKVRLPEIKAGLGSADPSRRMWALRRLVYTAAHWSPDLELHILTGLADSEEAVRRTALRVVRRRRWAEARPLLEARLGADPLIDEWIVEVLGALPTKGQKKRSPAPVP